MAEQRSELKRRQDRAEIARRFLCGQKQTVIAHAMGLNPVTVSRELRAIRQEWRDNALLDFHEAKVILLEKLDQIEREAWTAWEASKQPRTIKRQNAAPEDVTDGNATEEESQPVPKSVSPKSVSVTTISREGDLRFLAIIQKCITERSKLLDLYRPLKAVNAVNTHDTEPREYIAALTPEQRAQRLVELLNAVENNHEGEDEREDDGKREDNAKAAANNTSSGANKDSCAAPDFRSEPASERITDPSNSRTDSSVKEPAVTSSPVRSSQAPSPSFVTSSPFGPAVTQTMAVNPLTNYIHEAPPETELAERFVGMLPARF